MAGDFTLARVDWKRRLRAGESLMPDLPWLGTPAALRYVKIFNKLKLPDVGGFPALETAGGQWFKDFMAGVLGSADETGRLRVPEGFALTPKKQSKTTYGAAMMLTALIANVRPRAEFLLIGPTKLTADIAFSQAVGMVEQDPERFLQKRMHVQDHLKTITDRKTGAKLMIKTFDTKVLTGTKPVGTMIDELHEIAEMSKAGKVIGQLRGGRMPNPEGFLIFITTQSDDPPMGVFRAELMKARAVRDGRSDVAMLPLLYEFPTEMVKDDTWRSPENWWMLCPNAGKSMRVEQLVPAYQEAVETGDEELRRWASQHLNIEIGVALHADRWPGADYWEDSVDYELESLADLIRRSEVVTMGIDGGGLKDLLSCSFVGRDKEDPKRWLMWTKSWVNPKALKLRPDAAAYLQDFIDDGEITLTERVNDDIVEMVDLAEQVEDAGLFPQENAIGVDPAGIGQVLDELGSREFAPEKIRGISQGWKLNGAILTTERRLAAGELVHADQRLTAWAAGNCKLEPVGNAVTITKQGSGAMKIDPIMATLNAVSLMSLNPSAGRSAYETEDLASVG